MLPADRVRVRHIIDAIEAATRFVQGRQRSDLDHDEMLLFALVRAVEIVGEASSRLSHDAQTALSDIPWSRITGMRNRLVHAYFDIDRDILWNTVTEALSPVASRLRAALDQDEPN
jgi:uncharacterized protein with HEPN domain